MTVHGRLDLLNIDQTRSAPAYEDLRDRSFTAEIGGITVRVAGLDDLVRMKRAAGGPVDLDDIGTLMRTDEQLEREAREST
jgi:ribosomal protein S28E/S33